MPRPDWTTDDFFDHYNDPDHHEDVSLDQIGLLDDFRRSPEIQALIEDLKSYYGDKMKGLLQQACADCPTANTASVAYNAHEKDLDYDFHGRSRKDVLFVMGLGQLYSKGPCNAILNCKTGQFTGKCDLQFYVRDAFANPWDVFKNKFPFPIETGYPYKIRGDWDQTLSW